MDKMPKVKLIRQEKRKGLMVTRMTGVMESVSQVLTFLDSHIEATEGWLEPLLERVHLNPKAIACPVIEEVNDKTFQYKFVQRDLVGVFFWNLDFFGQNSLRLKLFLTISFSSKDFSYQKLF